MNLTEAAALASVAAAARRQHNEQSSPERKRAMTPAPLHTATERRNVIHRHPLAVFLVWFFTVGQAIAFVPLVLDGVGMPVSPHLFVIASTLVGLLLPALVITRVVDGREGLRRLLAAGVRVHVAARWWVVALVPVPIAAVAVWLLLFGMPSDEHPIGFVADVLGVTILQTVLGLVTANWAEEVAWMGFVQTRLQQGRSIRAAALLTAPLFALQHVSLAAQNGLVAGAIVLIALAVLSVPFRLLTGWLTARSSSLLLVGIFHAVGNAVASGSGFGDGTLRTLYPDTPFGFAHLAAYAIVAIVVLIATRGRFGDRPALERTAR